MLKLKGFPSVKEIQEAESKEKPLVLAPSIRANCNYRCIMCYVPSGKFVRGEVGLEEHKSVIKQITKIGAKYMIIAMVGEPFLDPAFYDKKTGEFPLVDYANEHGMYVVVFTNSSLLTPEILDKLKKKDISLIGKLWSFNPDLDNELTGKIKEFVRYKGVLIPKGLKLMINAGFNEVKNKETRLGIDIIVTARNYREIPRIVEYAISNGIKPVIDTMIPTERAQLNYKKLRLTDKQNKWLYSRLIEILSNKFTTEQFVEGCAIRRVGLAYDNFGNVKVCCALGANVGNIKELSIKELYKKIQFYRKKLPTFKKIDGTLNPCDTARLVKEQMRLD